MPIPTTNPIRAVLTTVCNTAGCTRLHLEVCRTLPGDGEREMSDEPGAELWFDTATNAIGAVDPGDEPENRKGVTYYLHEGRTKTGKPRYFFARSIGEGALDSLPDGYEVAHGSTFGSCTAWSAEDCLDAARSSVDNDPRRLPPMPAESDLLMVHADELSPVLEHAATPKGADGETTGYEDPEHLWDESREANELPAQRWGVIIPEGPEGDALLGRIERLVAHRQEQQGAPVKVFRVPSGLDAAEAMRWRKQHFDGPNIRRRDLPRYQLILGDLHQVSAEVQMIQGSDGYVGRLAFDHPEDYEAYVDKLLRWEGAPAPISRARAVFHTVKDRTVATTTGHQSLMVPGLALARRYQEEGNFMASTLVEVDHGYTPKPGPMLEEAIKDEPGVLLTMSHGAGAPRRGWRSVEEQHLIQGGMSFGPAGGLLTGEALAGRPFMPGGVWLMLACFGAGTPDKSKYQRWLEQLASTGSFQGSTEAVGASLPADGRPFMAALPKAVLASAQGPLAFIGHVDLAWTYSFRERDTGVPVDRPDRFVDVLDGILRHDRVGAAFRKLVVAFGRTNTELTTLDETNDENAERRGHLWMLRNDLAGYVLLGDPAARLPLRPEVAQVKAPIDPYAALGLVPSSRQTAQPPEPAAAAAPGVDPEALERAIGLHMVGVLGVAKILQECGLALGRREFEELARRYSAAGREALGL